jgi:hypothetical protein
MDAIELKNGDLMVAGVLGKYYLDFLGLCLQAPDGQWFRVKIFDECLGWR